MIICVTLNPCLDKTLVVPPWRPGENVRGTATMDVAGGKGNNVARALERLGHDARPLLPLGGVLGPHCERLLREQDGLEPLVARTEAPTREILTVRTGDTAEQSAFFDPDPVVTPEEHRQLGALGAQALETGEVEYVCMSGSSPCAELDPFWAEAIALARRHDVPTLLDTYGETLHEALAAGPTAVKLNRHEAEMWLGEPIADDVALGRALVRLQECGPRWAIITLGPDGAVGACGDERWKAVPPPIKLSNPIGSGDAMAAAFIHAQLAGKSPRDTFVDAVAGGTANARVWVAGAISPDAVANVARGVKLSPLI